MTILINSRRHTVVGAAAVLTLCLLVRDPVWVNMAVMIGIQALIALSVGLCFGQAGLLSLAQAPLAALGAYATGIAAVKYGVPPLVGLAFAVGVPALVGYLLARLVISLEPLSVALATLALSAIIEIVLRNWESVTGGYIGLSGIPPVTGVVTPVMYMVMTWVLVCLAVFVYENLMHSRFGRALKTIRHDRARATADGVPVARVMSVAFALSAAFAGLGGWLYAHYITYLGPSDLGLHLSITVVLMAVVGGTSFVLGPVVGAVVLGLLAHVLPGQEWQGLFFGGTLVLILVVAKSGILGVLASWTERLMSSRKQTIKTPARPYVES